MNELVDHNQKVIRFDLRTWQVAPSGDQDNVNWDIKKLAQYETAIKYASDKGLDVFLVSVLPEFANQYSQEDYQKLAKTYYSTLATKLNGAVKIWQILNEPDIYRPQGYKLMLDYNNSAHWPEDYLQNISALIKVARDEIKAQNPNALITTNVGGPLNIATTNRWRTFYDEVAPNLDAITLDTYPDSENISLVSKTVDGFKLRYLKPVFIGELGSCQIDQPDVAPFIKEVIDHAKASEADKIIAYQYKDADADSGDDCLRSGVVTVDGSQKPFYNLIIGALKN